MAERNDIPKDIAKITEDEAFLQASLKFSERMTGYPKDIQVAMGITMLNVAAGCPWGITSETNKEFMSILPSLKTSSHVKAYKLAKHPGRGAEDKYIVLVNLKEMITILDREAKGIITSEDLKNAVKRHDDAIKRFYAFLQEGRYGDVAIYSLNKGQDIIASGRRYPAFSITLSELVSACMTFNYNIVFGKDKVRPDVVNKNLEKAYSNMLVAPSENGIFIKIAKIG